MGAPRAPRLSAKSMVPALQIPMLLCDAFIASAKAGQHEGSTMLVRGWEWVGEGRFWAGQGQDMGDLVGVPAQDVVRFQIQP